MSVRRLLHQLDLTLGRVEDYTGAGTTIGDRRHA